MKDRDLLMYHTATLYYLDELTQTDIAKELNISRPTVSSLLKEAKERNIVNITINYPRSGEQLLRNKILTTYGLKNVQIVNNSFNELTTKKDIGRATANFIEKKIDPDKTLGIGWGSTLYEYVKEASYLSTSFKQIVSMIGGYGFDQVEVHSNKLSLVLSEKYSSHPVFFYAPAVVKNRNEYHELRSSRLIQESLNQARNVDIAVVTVDNPSQDSALLKWGYATAEDIENFREERIIGNLLKSFYDKNGNEINNYFSDSILSLELDELTNIKDFILIANGTVKTQSVKALLSKNIVDHLIIDYEIAKNL